MTVALPLLVVALLALAVLTQGPVGLNWFLVVTLAVGWLLLIGRLFGGAAQRGNGAGLVIDPIDAVGVVVLLAVVHEVRRPGRRR